MNIIYTIGYTPYPIDIFISTLLNYGVTCLIDVRSTPFSQHYSDYNKEPLGRMLKEYNILYRNYAHEFGARQKNKCFYSQEGFLDFEKFINSQQFADGVQKIEKGMQINYTFALMCAEKDPINCHRSIMVGQGLKKGGYNVNHIKENGKLETQEQLEKRLLNIYYKDRDQLSLFSDTSNEESLIKECYRKRNKEIGYSQEEL